MMSNLGQNKELFIPFAALFIIFLTGLFSLPIMPIDETRYVSVAWEMWAKKSFLLPILNGHPYSHKPPLFFWLMHIGWFMFGVNSYIPRIIPFIFSVLSLFLTYKISKLLWPSDSQTSSLSIFILSSFWMYVLWSFLIMFDMILCFWVLLGIFGIIRSFKSKLGWVFLWLSLSFGGLTKGPVILVHILPVVIFSFWWSQHKVSFKWYLLFVIILILAFLTDLSWVISAIHRGGHLYEKQILWTQTANRVVSAFAHKRPLWWYVSFLPLILAPWIFLTWKYKLSLQDRGVRLCVVWVFGSFFLFSIISSKQIHYLLPELPGFALLLSKNLNESDKLYPKALAFIFFILALFLFCSPFFKFIPEIHLKPLWILTPFLLILGAIFFMSVKFKNQKSLTKSVSLSIYLVFIFFLIGCRDYLNTFDLSYPSKIIAQEIKQGKEIVYIGKYHGEFHFLGRIKKKFWVFRGINSKLKEFLSTHPNSVVITNFKIKKLKKLPSDKEIIYKQKIRGRLLILWDRDEFINFFLKKD